MDAKDELRAALKAAIVYVGRVYAIKSVIGVVDSFEVALTKFCTQAWAGRMDKVDFQRAARALIKQSAPEVYIEGMIEGGMADEAEAREAMTEADNAAIRDYVSSQSKFVNAFAADVLAVREAESKPAAQEMIFSRCKTWAQSLAALGARGHAAADANKMGTWKFGDTDHCATCAKLDGKRHRLSWFVERGYIPREPGSVTLECHGFNCQCKIVDDDGGQLM